MLKFDSITSASGKTHAGFTSKFSNDAEAAAAIDADPKASEFAKGLAEKEQGFRKRGWTLSEAQRFWLHRVATPKPSAHPTPTAPLADSKGRVTVQGTVISTQLRPSGPHWQDRWSFKILVVLADGNRVWGTCPAPLVDRVKNGEKEVTFTAKVVSSEKDPHFGFFSHPKAA